MISTTPIKLAVICASFNRKDQTLACFSSITAQTADENIECDIYLLDDSSTDGTADSVRAQFPKVKLLTGNGQYFWNRGMHAAFEEAISGNYDFYLWANDDTMFYSDAIERLLRTFEEVKILGKQLPIVVGSTCAENGITTTYGGVRKRSFLRPVNYALVSAGDESQQVDTMNGNCVLIPAEVVDSIGNLDVTFQHYLGDHDYGLRACYAGHNVWLAPGHIGVCENSSDSRRVSNTKSFSGSLSELKSPKGLVTRDADLPSFGEWKVYCKRHAGLFWGFYWVYPYRRLIRSMLPWR